MRIFSNVANEIINIIKTESDLKEEYADKIIRQIEKIEKDSGYIAPECNFISWENLSKVLGHYFVPSNSKWETKIMMVFNDLSGTIDDYWDGDKGEQ